MLIFSLSLCVIKNDFRLRADFNYYHVRQAKQINRALRARRIFKLNRKRFFDMPRMHVSSRNQAINRPA
jgi:hypothetical protein